MKGAKTNTQEGDGLGSINEYYVPTKGLASTASAPFDMKAFTSSSMASPVRPTIVPLYLDFHSLMMRGLDEKCSGS